MFILHPLFTLVMKKLLAEKNIVIFLFVIVIVIFSFAERDSQKLQKVYVAGELLEKAQYSLHETASIPFPAPLNRN